MRVLLVDDSPSDALLMQLALGTLAEVTIVSSLTEALEHLSRDLLPDIVLCDVHLPVGTGFDLARFMAGDPRLQAVPVILVSGSMPGHEDPQEALDMGAIRLLYKPICFDALEQTIREAVIAASKGDET